MYTNSTATTSNGNAYKTLTYPNDLYKSQVIQGNTVYRYPYFMMIYANLQAKSELAQQAGTTVQTTNDKGQSVPVVGTAASSQYNTNVTNAVQTTGSNALNTITNFSNKNLKTNIPEIKALEPAKRSIFNIGLPMPTDVTFGDQANYTEMDSGYFGSLISTLTSNESWGQKGNQLLEGVIRNAPSMLAGKESGGTSGTYQQFINKMTGKASLQRKEMLFQGVEMRRFNFHWLIIPQTEQDSTNITNIIRFLRYNQYPELEVPKAPNTSSTNTADGAVGGFFVNIPNEFDFEFKYVDGQNNISNMQGIPKISTCLLTTVHVNYTPLGKFVGYDGTDNPVAIDLTLSFQETMPLNRQLISMGF